MRASEVLIIGAGPYGLSISTHLRGRGIDHLIVGRPMDTWRTHMPAGMYLKSEPYGSDMSCPQDRVRPRGLQPIGANRRYRAGDAAAARTVPRLRRLVYQAAGPRRERCHGDGDQGRERRVPGRIRRCRAGCGQERRDRDGRPAAFLHPGRAVGPAIRACLTYRRSPPFDQFRGRRVAIVGAGSSALETAALLHEAGGEVQLVVRCPDSPIWGTRALPLTPLVRLRNNKLCEGWKCPFWNSPTAFRRLPQNVRVEKARTVLGPLGAWWLRDRVEGVVEILGKTHVRGSRAQRKRRAAAA